jgi:hypothetical protein
MILFGLTVSEIFGFMDSRMIDVVSLLNLPQKQSHGSRIEDENKLCESMAVTVTKV